MAKGKKPGSDRFKTVIEPDTRILALDGEINRLVLQIELLEARRRRAEATGERRRVARQIRTQQKKIAKLYAKFSRTEPESLTGAATLLRRVPAMLNERPGDDDDAISIATRLVDSALVVVEKSAR